MRILHVVGAMNTGGTETWLLQLLPHLDRAKYQIDILVHTTEPGVYDAEARSLGVRIIPCLKPSNPLLYAYNFHRILGVYGPYDCVHCHMHQFSGFVLFLAAWMRIPLRLVHSRTDTRTIDRHASVIRKMYIALMEFLVQRYANRGVAISENAAASLFSESWRDDSRWSLCPTGIDLGPFEATVDPCAARAELGIASDAYVFGHVGRFVELKNHRFLVEIATHVVRQEPCARFLLIGDGPLRPEIESIVHALGLSWHFIFTGNRRDVPRLMKGAMDCFVFPSQYEGLGRVMWEAQAAGLPCLCSEAMPNEVSLSSSMVHRMRLGASAQNWAEALVEMKLVGRPSRQSLASHSARVSILVSQQLIQAIYGEANEGRLNWK